MVYVLGFDLMVDLDLEDKHKQPVGILMGIACYAMPYAPCCVSSLRGEIAEYINSRYVHEECSIILFIYIE